ncbi:hypothetical protein KPL33_01170 [Clostridium algidicarnis]|uniref:hypothetical protein n=1 Tax=Clostridium algidicarnis TaxID=37659 RepID=UPI001C0DA3B2|nr:hypothetical protein [Clostridium algidicarnis]MBU3205588.1 hypothetical protein [Clostridium algidicarnis]
MKEFDKELKDNKVNLIEILGVFIAVFSLISINVSFLGVMNNLNSILEKISMVVVINVTIILSIKTLFKLIKNTFK